MLALQLLVNALALGAAYALVALGFVLVLNATQAVNFAQGDLVAAGGYAAVALAAMLPLPGIVLLPAVLALAALLGLALSLVAYFPMRGRASVGVFVTTIASGIIIQNALNLRFGAEPRAAPPLWPGGALELGGIIVPRQSLAIVAVAAVLLLGGHLLLARTQLGRCLRAAAQDPETARLVGIRVARAVAVSFMLAAALAGAAGLLLANQFFVTPTAGNDLMLKAYVATTIGGWGSLPGAVLGALLIALFEVAVSRLVSYEAAMAGLYAALLAILWLRPQGLLGEAWRRRA